MQRALHHASCSSSDDHIKADCSARSPTGRTGQADAVDDGAQQVLISVAAGGTVIVPRELRVILELRAALQTQMNHGMPSRPPVEIFE